MPKLFVCHDCGERVLKPAAIVSRFTGRAWCIDKAACARRVKRNARRTNAA
jgi:hypothetical protein